MSFSRLHGQGTIRGQEAVVHIDPATKPRAFPPPPVPFPLRQAVEEELDRLTHERNAPADMISRFSVDKTDTTSSIAEKMGERSQLLHLKLQDITLSKKEIRQKTVSDLNLSRVLAYMERGWPANTASLPKELHTFFEKRLELAVEENMLLWRGRIVVPESLRHTFLQLLHDGHPGVSSTREIAKFYAWWPRIDNEIEH